MSAHTQFLLGKSLQQAGPTVSHCSTTRVNTAPLPRGRAKGNDNVRTKLPEC